MSSTRMIARRTDYGTRVRPRANVTALAATFNGIYLRPNSANQGETPAAQPVSSSPDIWIGGTNAVPNFQTALATQASYATSSSSNVTENYTNYIYVRGLNGSSTTQTRTVALYYAPNAIIPWPGSWVKNVIRTDHGNKTANITNLAPGQIGVADQTFLWEDVPPPPSGSDHYCLFAQLNDVNNSNPFPDITSQLDMSALIQNNLGWGWRNVTLVSSAAPTWQYSQQLTIANDLPAQNYNLDVSPVGYVGWSVSFTCSQTDSKGNPMNLNLTQIQQDNVLLGVTNCYLEPGFSATVTIYMTNNGKSSSPGASVPLSCTYPSKGKQAEEAIRRGLADWRRTRAFEALYPEDIGPTAVVPLGAMNYQSVPPDRLAPTG